MKAFAILLLLGACAPLKNVESEQKGLIFAENAKIKRWPNPQRIPVCFANADQVAKRMLDNLRTVVTSEYHAKTNVRFTGFAPCTQKELTEGVIRVNFQKLHDWDTDSTSGGGRSQVGPDPKNCSDGNQDCGNGTLNIHIGKRGDFPDGTTQFDFIVNYTNRTILHEFGHALGLGHEHMRKDGETCDDYYGDLEDGGVYGGDVYRYVGKPDAQSIMNYCLGNKVKAALSSGDVAVINFLYPKPLPSMRPSEAFLVMHVPSKRCLKSGSSGISLAECENTKDFQYQTLSNDDGTFLIRSVGSDRCLDAPAAPNTKLSSSPCQSMPSQHVNILPAFDVEDTRRLQFAHDQRCFSVDLPASTLTPVLQMKGCDSNRTMNFRFIGTQGIL